MARKTVKQTVEPAAEPETRTAGSAENYVGAAQYIISTLTETGIPFAEDAWLDEQNGIDRTDYGVVEILGADELWGDDQVVLQTFSGNVVLYVMDGDDRKARDVQAALAGVNGISITLSQKEFLQDPVCNRWTWGFRLSRGF